MALTVQNTRFVGRASFGLVCKALILASSSDTLALRVVVAMTAGPPRDAPAGQRGLSQICVVGKLSNVRS